MPERRSNIVADGRERIAVAERKRVKRAVRQRYAAQFAKAGILRRWLLLWKIRREIEKELETIAPRDALYAWQEDNRP